VPTGWYRRGAISAPFSMVAARISGAPLLSPGCYCTRRIASSEGALDPNSRASGFNGLPRLEGPTYPSLWLFSI
jgi:hypothetical protein